MPAAVIETTRISETGRPSCRELLEWSVTRRAISLGIAAGCYERVGCGHRSARVTRGHPPHQSFRSAASETATPNTDAPNSRMGGPIPAAWRVDDGRVNHRPQE